jgi:hypothetical protein
VLLAATGPYGLIAHSVAERRREFGIRLALSATPGATLRTVAMSGIVLAALGVMLGGAMSASRCCCSLSPQSGACCRAARLQRLDPAKTQRA